MADQEDDHPEMDYSAHRITYDAFIGGTKYTIIAIAIVLILMAAFL